MSGAASFLGSSASATTSSFTSSFVSSTSGASSLSRYDKSIFMNNDSKSNIHWEIINKKGLKNVRIIKYQNYDKNFDNYSYLRMWITCV